MKKPIFCAGVLLLAAAAQGQHDHGGSVHVMSAWSRALPPVSQNGAVYLTLKNYSGVPDRLVEASSPIAARIEFHTHATEEGAATMRRIESVVLESGEYVRFEPGGKHLMLIGLERPLKEGEQIPLTLKFENAPERDVMVRIMPVSAMGPGAAGHGHSEMHGHEHSKKHGHDAQ